MKRQSPADRVLIVNTECDLHAYLREISQRMIANPHLAQLILINPILVLEDLGGN